LTKSKKVYDIEMAKLKIEQYCVYQDRCHSEVEEKLKSFGLIQNVIDVLMESLIENKFLDEERYARAYTRGAYRHKKWGWVKIKNQLKQKGLTSYCIKKSYEEIDQEEYNEMIQYQLKKKWQTIKGKNKYDKINKLTRFGLTRGYEYETITSLLNDIVTEEDY